MKDKLDKGTNPAVDTLADTVYSELKAGRDVHLMGYSQGGLITSAGAQRCLATGCASKTGCPRRTLEKLMSKLNVETFGAASTTYPDGPQYVHYVNNADAVPTVTGLGGSVDPLTFIKNAGKDAVVHRFTDGDLNPIGNHSSGHPLHEAPRALRAGARQPVLGGSGPFAPLRGCEPRAAPARSRAGPASAASGSRGGARH